MDRNATLTRRQFIVTAATAAGGVAVALGTGPSAFAAAAAAHSLGATRKATTRMISTPSSRLSLTIPCLFAMCARRWGRAA